MQNITPGRALLSARVVWCALLGGQLAFVLVILGIWRSVDIHMQAEPHVRHLVRYAGVAALLVCVPLGYYFRMQTYKRYWRGSVIAPQGYFTGNLVLFALLETAGTISLAAALVSGSFWPAGVPAGIALAVHLANFPNGKPMLAEAGGAA
jgi:hypothetical protein